MKIFKLKKLLVLITVAITFIATITILTTFIDSNNDSTNKITGDNADSPYYETLYGTWSISNHIPSNIKTTLSDSIISFCIGQEFTIGKDNITSIFATISNPTIKEGLMTASDFSNTYNDTFKNLGISGDKIKYIRITQTEKTTNYVTIFIADDGNVYALLKGALFELKKL